MRWYPSIQDISEPERLERTFRQIMDMIYDMKGVDVTTQILTDSQLKQIKSELEVNGKYPLNLKGLPS